MTHNRPGTGLMLGGLLLIAAALLLTGYNLREQRQAGEASFSALELLRSNLQSKEQKGQLSEPDGQNEPELPEYVRHPEINMSVVEIYGEHYIGVLEIPTLSISLPIISQWNYNRLKIAPCRYEGSAYENDLILMAHNYATHFGRLQELSLGDPIFFTDVEGNLFRYEVMEVETMDRTEVERMSAGDWDLTLFTCTLGGYTRFAVRCEKLSG